MSNFIPLSVPNLKGNEEKYVLDAIRTEWVSTGGSYINQFEEELAKYVGANGAVACQSGTAGLHLALKLSEVEIDDEVIVPTLTFIAAVNPVKYVGAHPVFMDCDDTLTLDPIKLQRFCEQECDLVEGCLINRKTGHRIKAIVVVHVFGNIADMEKVMEIAYRYNLKVIEDATEALGSYYTKGIYQGKFAGTIGDYGVYSFNGNKIITTGGGGMLIAKDEQQLKYAKYLSTQAKDDEIFYVHHDIGYNYRMTNLQAAVGVAQLEQLEIFIRTKETNYEYYHSLMNEETNVKLLEFQEELRPNYWFYSLMIDFEKVKISKEKLIKELARRGIQTRPIWGLIHEQIPYRDYQAYCIEKAMYYHERVINIPCSSNLTKANVEYIVECIKQILR